MVVDSVTKRDLNRASGVTNRTLSLRIVPMKFDGPQAKKE